MGDTRCGHCHKMRYMAEIFVHNLMTISISRKKQAEKPTQTKNNDKARAPVASAPHVSVVEEAEHSLTKKKNVEEKLRVKASENRRSDAHTPFSYSKHTKKHPEKTKKFEKAKIKDPERTEVSELIHTKIRCSTVLFIDIFRDYLRLTSTRGLRGRAGGFSPCNPQT